MEKFKVSSKTDSAKLAGAIAGVIRGGNDVEMQAVGAASVNQAIKATAIARGFLSPSGIEIAMYQASEMFSFMEKKERP